RQLILLSSFFLIITGCGNDLEVENEIEPEAADESGGPAVDESMEIIKISGDLYEYREYVNETFFFEVVGSRSGTIWGTDIYTDDSPVGTAAVHAGLIDEGEQAVVEVRILPGQDSYEASSQNAIDSYEYGVWYGSYEFLGVLEETRRLAEGDSDIEEDEDVLLEEEEEVTLTDDESEEEMPDAIIESVEGEVGEEFTYSVTGSVDGLVIGTSVYHPQSDLATSAVHAGLLTEGEAGQVTIRITEEPDFFPASTRNGIVSEQWMRGNFSVLGDYRGGYEFVNNKEDHSQRVSEDEVQAYWRYAAAFAVGENHSAGILPDGTVEAKGTNYHGELDVENWTDVVQVVVGSHHTVALHFDGTVSATGRGDNSQLDTADWTDIVAVSTGDDYTVGLQSDGQVVSTPLPEDWSIDSFSDIVYIDAGSRNIVGVKADGSVVTASDQVDLSNWEDIVQVSCGRDVIVGLKADGTAKIAHSLSTMHDWEKSVLNWVDLVYLVSGYQHYDDVVMGLMRDGRALVSVNTEVTIRQNVEENQGLIAITPEAGIKEDGQVVIFYPIRSSGGYMEFQGMRLRN
ncbi:MAG: hypothetical protein JJU01_09790, partial [Alkalibacterium sp.]|nr:hypothetical protein [Alkalibacterium sp.]